MARKLTPSRLALARHLRGLTQAALAKQIGISPGAVSQFESGLSQPSPDTLERLAMSLKVTPAFLWRAEVSDEQRPFFRSLVRVPAPERERARAYAVVLADVVSELDRVLELPKVAIGRLTDVGPDTPVKDIEGMAVRARSQWRVPPGPLANVTAMAESRGIVVVAVGDFHPGIDAFTLKGLERPVVVLCSDKGVATRRRFDVAHEIAHIVLHSERADNPRWQETQAHRFASALLMPANEIYDYLPRRGDDLRALEQIARDWGVSMQAAMMRARDLGCIDEVEFARGMKRMSAAGWRRREPVEVGPPETPTLLQAAVASLAVAGTSIGALADKLGLPVARLTRMLRLPEDFDDTHRGEVVPLRG
jgi:Zn-dependent peptidase ImmA (M78 family)/transcriptional regulator with XRE-family HTH domain